MPYDDKPLSEDEWSAIRDAQTYLANQGSRLRQGAIITAADALDVEGYAESLAGLFAAHEVE